MHAEELAEARCLTGFVAVETVFGLLEALIALEAFVTPEVSAAAERGIWPDRT